jgi:hypothetical protein
MKGARRRRVIFRKYGPIQSGATTPYLPIWVEAHSMVQKLPVCHAYTRAVTINATISKPIATMIVTFRTHHRGVDSIEPKSRAE